MPKFDVIAGGKPAPNLDAEIAYQKGLADLHRLQVELGGDPNDIHSLRVREAACTLALERGARCAMLVLAQELEALAKMMRAQ